MAGTVPVSRPHSHEPKGLILGGLPAHRSQSTRGVAVRRHLCRLAIATLALAISAPLAAQGQLDTLRIDSLMSIAADRVRSAAIAAAREDAAVVLDARIDLFGFGGVFGEVLGELAAAGFEQARRWVTETAEQLFWLSSSLTLAAERSADGKMDQWPIGPEVILERLEVLQEIWTGIKDENRELCNRSPEVAARDSRANPDSGVGRRPGDCETTPYHDGTNPMADPTRYRKPQTILTLPPILPGRTPPPGGSLHHRLPPLLVPALLLIATPASAQYCDIGDFDDIRGFRNCLAEHGLDALGAGILRLTAAETGNGLTALHLAAEPGFVKALVAAGAGIDVRNDRGQTPLHQAVRFRDAAVVEVLLDAGADPSLEDNEGNRAADLVAGNPGIESDSDLVRRLRGRRKDHPPTQ